MVGIGVLAFEKHADAHDLEIVHAGRQGRGPGSRKVAPLQKNIDVLGRADGRGFAAGHPEGHRLAANQGEGHAGGPHRAAEAPQAGGDVVQGHRVLFPGVGHYSSRAFRSR